MVEKGYYKHYKGGIYKVVSTAEHTETKEEVVLYEDLENKLWCRPESVFSATVEVEDSTVKRFEPIKVAVVATDSGYEMEGNTDDLMNPYEQVMYGDIAMAKYYNPKDKYEMLLLKVDVAKNKANGRRIELTHMKRFYNGVNTDIPSQDKLFSDLVSLKMEE